jgi:hypothetical protein
MSKHKRNHNTEDEKLRKDLEEINKLADLQRDEDIRSLMLTPVGRRFMWWLLDKQCNLHGTTFTGDSQTFHNEGQRFVAASLMLKIQDLVPDMYALMVKEGMEDLIKFKSLIAQKRLESVKAKEEEDGYTD